jgi:hypothetical protein
MLRNIYNNLCDVILFLYHILLYPQNKKNNKSLQRQRSIDQTLVFLLPHNFLVSFVADTTASRKTEGPKCASTSARPA